MFDSADKVSSWLILAALSIIPLVNIILIVGFAFFMNVDPAFRAFARASLVVFAISLVVFIGGILLGLGSALSLAG